MDYHFKEYYRESSEGTPQSSFHSVIALHDSPAISWTSISQKVPELTRGWYELSHLSTRDRIEFTRDFWLSKLPYRQGLDDFLFQFFDSLDDIGIFITQKKFADPYEVELIYSIKNNSGFFKGGLPISDKNLTELQNYFSDITFPKDYLAFLQIHNGFSKATDSTGIISSIHLPGSYLNFQDLIQQHDPILTSKNTNVDPKKLIPFYESFGMPFFQCFWAEWYPEDEMGNVYYSGEARTISDIYADTGSVGTMAFPTFVDWLMFYLECIQ